MTNLQKLRSRIASVSMNEIVIAVLQDEIENAESLLQPHDTAAESGVNRIDILSNGFKVITTDAGQNTDGSTYVYWAFAKSPFVNSNGVPTTARGKDV